MLMLKIHIVATVLFVICIIICDGMPPMTGNQSMREYIFEYAKYIFWMNVILFCFEGALGIPFVL